MIELLKKLDEKDSIDLNEEIKNVEIDEAKALLISKYIIDNNKALIRKSNEIKDSSNNKYISDLLEDTFESIREKRYIDGIEDKNLIELLNFAISHAIENLKIENSLSELIAESYILTYDFYNKFFNKFKINEVFDIFNIYISIMQIKYQHSKIKDEYDNTMNIILYCIIKKELEEKEIDEIIKSKKISKEYYETLDKLYSEYEIEMDKDYLEKAKAISDEYEYMYSTFLLDYIDTSVLLTHLKLNKEKVENCNKSMLENILIKLSEFE